MRPENLGFHGENAERANAAFPWIIAFDAFDFCDPAPLDELLRSDEPIPLELRPILADIVSGERKPNKRAAAKLKVPAAERMKIAGSLSAVLGLTDMLKHDAEYDLAYGLDARQEVKSVELRAGWRGVEPIEYAHYLERERADAIRMVMEHFGISEETVENYLRDLRSKIRNYPKI